MYSLVRWITKPRINKKILNLILRGRSHAMFADISPFFARPKRILDVGAGTCNTTEVLRNEGYNVIPLDVIDFSIVDGIRPLLYDGANMPFKIGAFDLAVVLTTLHHAIDVERVLAETTRVSKKIIIIEDVYKNWLHKYATWWLDSLINLEFVGHPHNNKCDRDWRALFERLGLELLAVKQRWSLGIMWQLTYNLAQPGVEPISSIPAYISE